MRAATVGGIVDSALARLQKVPARRLYEVARKNQVPFFPADDPSSAVVVSDVYPSPRALQEALGAKDVIARRSALALFVAAHPGSAWPLLRPFCEPKPPAKATGLNVVTKTAGSLVVAIPNIPDDELVELIANPRRDLYGLVAAALHHRKTVDERVGLLERTLTVKMTNETWRLAESLYEELSIRSRARLLPILRLAAQEKKSWEKWAREGLVSLGDTSSLESAATDLDAAQPQPAINATIALGPARWPDLEKRFFTKELLKTRSGRARASSILHSIATKIALERADSWKKARAFVALVDSLADANGDSLAFGAASLSGELRGRKPLSRD